MPTSYAVSEMWDSRSGSRGGEDSEELLIFDVQGSGDAPDAAGARAAVLASYAPIVFEGLFRNKVRHKCRGGARWLVEVDYSSKAAEKPDDDEEGFRIGVRWSIGTEQQRRLVALKTIATKSASGHTAIDFKGAINVAKDRVEGVDVPVGVATLTLTVYRKPAELTAEYFDAILPLAGKVNDDTFYGRPAGSLRFAGVDVGFVYDSSIDPDDQEFVPLPFIFEYSPPGSIEIEGLNDGDALDKKGWEYVWPYFEETVNSGASLLIAKPVQLTNVQVIEEADFADLGIGTEFSA